MVEDVYFLVSLEFNVKKDFLRQDLMDSMTET